MLTTACKLKKSALITIFKSICLLSVSLTSPHLAANKLSIQHSQWSHTEQGKWRQEWTCQTPTKATKKTTQAENCDDAIGRQWRVFLPKQYEQLKSLPVIFDFHGTTGNINKQIDYSGFEKRTEKSPFIIITPQGKSQPFVGFGGTVHQFTTWNADLNQDKLAVDDLSFIKTLISHIKHHYKVNPDRVFASGMSGGGRMVSRMACSPQFDLAAIASSAGLQYPLASDKAVACKPNGPIPIMTFHSVDDKINQYAGKGILATWRQGVLSSMLLWAENNGCDLSPQPGSKQAPPASYKPKPLAKGEVNRVASTWQTIEHNNCNQDSNIVLYSLEGVNHTWTTTPDTSSLIMSFFEQH